MSTTQSLPHPIAASNAKKATLPPAFEVEEPTPPYTTVPEPPVAPIAPIIREDAVATETEVSTSAGANVATDYIDPVINRNKNKNIGNGLVENRNANTGKVHKTSRAENNNWNHTEVPTGTRVINDNPNENNLGPLGRAINNNSNYTIVLE